MAATTTQSRPAPTRPVTNVPASKGVAELITANIGVINKLIPKHLNADRMIHLAIQLARRPELATCTPASFVGVFMESAKLGLELDSRGLAYAVPFMNRKVNPPRREAQFLVGYKGLIKLATNSGKVRNIYAHEVRANDEFDYGYGAAPFLHHKPLKNGDRGEVTHVYAVGRFSDGDYHFEVMTIDEVYAVRDQFSKAKDSGPWVENPREMCLKTVCRRLCKFLPASPELAQAVALDEAAEAGIPQDFSVLPDLNTIEADYTETVDQDAEDMEKVKAQVRNGNGVAGSKPAAEKPKAQAAPPVKGAPPAQEEQQDETPLEGEASESTPPDHLAADKDILYQDFRSRILRAGNQAEAVAVYTEAVQDSILGSDHLAKLQSDLRETVNKIKGRK